jgi:hypothetical protein
LSLRAIWSRRANGGRFPLSPCRLWSGRVILAPVAQQFLQSTGAWRKTVPHKFLRAPPGIAWAIERPLTPENATPGVPSIPAVAGKPQLLETDAPVSDREQARARGAETAFASSCRAACTKGKLLMTSSHGAINSAGKAQMQHGAKIDRRR